MMRFRIKLNSTKRNKSGRTFFDLEKLKNPETAEKFRVEIARRFAPMMLLDKDEQELCDEITSTFVCVAGKELGKAARRNKSWITPEVRTGEEQLESLPWAKQMIEGSDCWNLQNRIN